MRIILVITFLLNIVPVYAQSPELILPAPGQMVSLSKPLVPVSLKGLKVDPKNPMRFDFILQEGDKKIPPGRMQEQGMDLVKYFLAALTTPEKDVWVNLSPYEHDRMIPQDLSLTLLGRDMLAQDYLLKQMTSSLLYPNDGVGQEFWKQVYTKAKSGFAGAQIPVKSFNKVWILPDQANVYTKGQTVIITGAHLKVMLDHDCNAVQKNTETNRIQLGQQDVAEQAMRDIIIPVLEKEINEGAHFAPLRQIFHAAILAEWYKRHFRQSILGQHYANQNKVSGIDETPTQFKENLYQQYLQAYKKGVYNFVREDRDPQTGEMIPRKYFSGGLNVSVSPVYREDAAMTTGDPQQEQFQDFRIDMAVPDALKLSPSQGVILRLENPYWKEMKNSFKFVMTSAPNDNHLDYVIKDVLEKNVRVTSGWLPLKNGSEVFAVRVANSDVMGTPKGGIRWTKASDLMKDKEFLHEWQAFLKTQPNKDEVRGFIAKWLTQEANSLAIGMTLKTAGLGNNLGGAKGDVFLGDVVLSNGQWVLKDIPIEMYSDVARAHARQLVEAKAVGIKIDSPAPDVNTNPLIMSWYTDEMIKVLVAQGEKAFLADIDEQSRITYAKKYSKLFSQLQQIQAEANVTPYVDAIFKFWQSNLKQGNKIPIPWLGVFTGLAVDKGGVVGRAGATGEGVVAVMKGYYQSKDQGYRGKTVAVQGFGNVGSFTAIAAAREGFNVTVINDKDITLVKRDGFKEGELKLIAQEMLNKNTLLSLWKRGFINPQGVIGIINDANDTDKELKVTQAVLWADVDVLVPAAMQLQISSANVNGVKARLVVEAANNPVYPAALKVLHERGIDVIPGILANAGGVFVSGLQMEQAATGRRLSQREVTARMTKVLTDAMKELSIWHDTQYKGSLSNAYVHYALSVLLKHAVQDKAMGTVVVSKALLAERFKNGADIFNDLVQRGLIIPLEKDSNVAFFSQQYENWVAAHVGSISRENFREIMNFIMQDLRLPQAADSAMAKNGGIDLNTSAMKINEQGSSINFDISQVNATSSIHGLVPIFVHMQPISMPALLAP